MPVAGGEWLDAGHNLIIVKACAGGNFLIAAWLGWLWRGRGRWTDAGAGRLRRRVADHAAGQCRASS